MPDEKGIFQGLVDFSFQQSIAKRLIKVSFQQSIAKRLIKVLYVIALLAGAVSLVAWVVVQMQQSAAQGMLALVFGVIALGVWVFYIRVMMELLFALFHIAENIGRMAGST